MLAAFERMLFKESTSKTHPSITVRLIPMANILAAFTYSRRLDRMLVFAETFIINPLG
jgi:hypothetical protein